MDTTIAAAKQALRGELLAARRERSAAEIATAAAALTARGLELLSTAKIVAAFASIPGEPPTAQLRRSLRALGVTVLLPIIAEPTLDWAIDDGQTTPGSLRIAEPTGARLGPDVLATADVVLLPALAADRNGHRLGRGRGHYDRALEGVSGPRLIAVVFDDEFLDQLPVESHDVAVDAVLTPSGLTVVGIADPH